MAVHENSKKNLKKGHPFTSETASEAGKKSSASRRAYMMITELADDILDEVIETTDPLTGKKEQMTRREKIIRAMMKKAQEGDIQAAVLVAKWAKEE